uniref:Uncharacterized protein n=1 Tax=Panagrolaimus superbus TaxID=310955 RepID=A0A914Y0E9_9BILA
MTSFFNALILSSIFVASIFAQNYPVLPPTTGVIPGAQIPVGSGFYPPTFNPGYGSYYPGYGSGYFPGSFYPPTYYPQQPYMPPTYPGYYPGYPGYPTNSNSQSSSQASSSSNSGNTGYGYGK